MKRVQITSFIVSILASLTMLQLGAASIVHASGPPECYNKGGFLNMPTWYEYLQVGPKTVNGNVVDPCAIIGPTETDAEGNDTFSFKLALPRIILAISEILLRVAGMVAVGYVIFGGIKYMASQGEPDGVKKAQGTVVNALIGLAIAVLATAIVGFIGGKLWL